MLANNAGLVECSFVNLPHPNPIFLMDTQAAVFKIVYES